ncbi:MULTISPECIES: hypothetical protein [Bradyrhizobium]|uniref:hypothetical protein n=1 Tax=Bradyrhizobium elkanii TaxID=29448 RepID=UPI0004273E53|nr:hypothetical protein [Bradyrhizobium elkanii]
MKIALSIALLVVMTSSAAAQYLGNYSADPYAPNSTGNAFGAGSPDNPNSINNPYAMDAPKLYDSQGNYRGRLSSNRYDPDSISNPYGRYGSRFSPDSVNNPFGAGNPYVPDSPTNPYGQGLSMQGADDG